MLYVQVRKNQSMLSTILLAKKIDYEQIDLTDPKNGEYKEKLIEDMKAKSLKFIPPIIYLEDEYLGVSKICSRSAIFRIMTIFSIMWKWKTLNPSFVFQVPKR